MYFIIECKLTAFQKLIIKKLTFFTGIGTARAISGQMFLSLSIIGRIKTACFIYNGIRMQHPAHFSFTIFALRVRFLRRVHVNLDRSIAFFTFVYI